ncbi:unnamed protein product [Amoebophrya sp. A120]|nr:unnamed protein product [Amoebophrya sp. A120]|eukprot:GSA120T00021015001.1
MSLPTASTTGKIEFSLRSIKRQIPASRNILQLFRAVVLIFLRSLPLYFTADCFSIPSSNSSMTMANSTATSSLAVGAAAASTTSKKLYDVAVVGGGLAGLTASYRILQQRPEAKILLLEANSKNLGGRVLSSTTLGNVDLGPAWFWPRDQPFMRNMVRELKLNPVEQADAFSGEMRLRGGIGAIVEKLKESLHLLGGNKVAASGETTSNPAGGAQMKAQVEADLPVDVKLGEKLVKMEKASSTSVDGEGTSTSTKIVRLHTTATTPMLTSNVDQQANNRSYEAKQVILAVPPKIAMRDVKMTAQDFPYLLGNPKLVNEMKSQPVWMAGMGKLVLFYDTRWWNAARANQTPMGPMRSKYGAFQIYDAGEVQADAAVEGDSSAKRKLYALAFFVGGEQGGQEITTDMMAAKVVEQLQVGAASRGGRGPFGGSLRMNQMMSFGSSSDDDSHAQATTSTIANYAHAEFKFWATEPAINPDFDAMSAGGVGRGMIYPAHPHPIRGLNDEVMVKNKSSSSSAVDHLRRVWFGNSEAAEEWSGMLEGAVRAAERAADLVVNALEAEEEAVGQNLEL